MLKVAVISLDIKGGEKQTNISEFCNTVDRVDADTDLIVLPELFSTGFTSNKQLLADLAESNGGETMALVHEIARKRNAAIAGSFLAKTAGHIYNRAFFVEPSGDETFYDKRHLFSMGSESKCLDGGTDVLPIIRFRGWNIGLIVCYDLRFPAWCRNKACGYDLLVVPANWPNSREYAWLHLLKARAIENQSYVIGANRSGEDKFGNYDGMTLALDYCGKLIQPRCDGEIIYAELDKASLDKWRVEFPVWRDADDFEFDI